MKWKGVVSASSALAVHLLLVTCAAAACLPCSPICSCGHTSCKPSQPQPCPVAPLCSFVLTLKKGRYTYQFGQYAWTHMILLVRLPNLGSQCAAAVAPGVRGLT